jgi:hypothetical protein
MEADIAQLVLVDFLMAHEQSIDGHELLARAEGLGCLIGDYSLAENILRQLNATKAAGLSAEARREWVEICIPAEGEVWQFTWRECKQEWELTKLVMESVFTQRDRLLCPRRK